ncbi:hypothetical protein ABIE26_002329 [Pedobacter africanus]|uniref:Uncharacterized protein n=1 Tax=Pedobacter africanus TaxID=151894 RepID=A0ACC6KYR4_9SPHI|nr:SusD/RagB family nutrient-binding outer membrane lipoprotein [Pedobacter africanus]MDR6784282.1 hypothetical protein [Pedobacter africanus]
MKMTNYKYILILPLLVLLSNGCKKFDEINENPHAATEVSSGMLATGMILNITRSDISTTKSFMQSFLLSKYLTWGENIEGFQYNRLGATDFARINLLRNVKPMVNAAQTEGLKKSYEALGHFIRAWQFFHTTMQVGDVPYSEAVKGEESGVIQPKYDSQKTVFLGILNELDQANQLFAEGAKFDGDPIYNGTTDNWRRLTNSFQLHVLINLYKKTGDADLKVTDRFKEVMTRPLMRDYKDNFALVYSATATQNYPWSNVPAGSNAFASSNYTMLSSYLINPLIQLQDRRLFYFAKPSPVKVTGGMSESNYNAYVGADPATNFQTLLTMKNGKDYSDFNNRYSQLVNAEPVSVFSYWDLQFILAEAAVRGWITGTPAQTYYASGISNSMNFTAFNTPDVADYHHNMRMDGTYIAAYTASAAVALTGTTEQQIEKIILQKYLANFLQGSKYLGWYENRRTGYPAFTLNAATNLNIPSTSFPLRWTYPSNETSFNAVNTNAAIASQYAGNDDTNQIMWILKN